MFMVVFILFVGVITYFVITVHGW
jgi:hypothetical protein